MRALVLNDQLRFDARYPRPEPDDSEALVHVLKAGICNTDLELIKGYMGFKGVLGHEFVGVVEGGSWDGRRIAGEINISCWACDRCLSGLNTQCPDRATLGIHAYDGAFADYLVLPHVNLHPIPDHISDDQVVFVEPLAAALQTLALTHISPHGRVALLGAGKLGLLVAQVVALTGCDLAVVTRHSTQRRLLSDWGIQTAGFDDLKPSSFDIVIDCTGHESGFADALTLVKPRGTIHLKSTYTHTPHADLTRVVVDEVKVVSSRCGPFDAAIRLLGQGLIDVESLIEARYPLDEGLKAIQHAGGKGTLKVILDI